MMTLPRGSALDSPAPADAATPRAARRRSIGPGPRAIVGGLLVTVAMVGAVALARQSSAPDTSPVVVASSAISPGDPLGPHNLAVEHLALPAQLLEVTYSDPSSLGGTVARSFVAAGETLQRGGVVEATAAQRAAAPSREISMRIDANRAADGRIEPGDRVDVLATYGNGPDALTFAVLTDVSVLTAVRSDGGIGRSETLVLTLALSDRASSLALAHAVDNAEVTVVRTTTATIEDDGPVEPYRVTSP